MKQVVIDASVVLRWYLKDEENGQKALDILYGFVSKNIDICAPALLIYEVFNGLWIAKKLGRIEKQAVLIALEGFLGLGIEFFDISDTYSRILDYCEIFNCSVYDASYLAVSAMKGISMITADRRLYQTVKDELGWVSFLGEM